MSATFPTKKCNTCEQVKPVSEFYTCARLRSGYVGSCRQCRHNKHLEDWERNHEKRLAGSKRYRDNNKDKVHAMCQAWHHANRDKVLARQKANREQSRPSRAAAARARRAKDPQTKIGENIRRRMRDALFGISKSQRTLDLIGCSFDALKLHIESKFRDGMTWDNYGPFWHLDHIKPCACFDLAQPEQQALCFHYKNLQPLLASENVRKSCFYTDPDTGITKYYKRIKIA